MLGGVSQTPGSGIVFSHQHFAPIFFDLLNFYDRSTAALSACSSVRRLCSGRSQHRCCGSPIIWTATPRPTAAASAALFAVCAVGRLQELSAEHGRILGRVSVEGVRLGPSCRTAAARSRSLADRTRLQLVVSGPSLRRRAGESKLIGPDSRSCSRRSICWRPLLMQRYACRTRDLPHSLYHLGSDRGSSCGGLGINTVCLGVIGLLGQRDFLLLHASAFSRQICSMPGCCSSERCAGALRRAMPVHRLCCFTILFRTCCSPRPG